MARTYWLPRCTASTSRSRCSSFDTLGAAILSTSRIRKIATIKPTSMKPCSSFAPLAPSAHERESKPRRRSQKQIFFIFNPSTRQQRQRLLIIIRHILHKDGVRRDLHDPIPPLHDLAV